MERTLGRLDTAAPDGSAIAASLLHKDFASAGTIRYLLAPGRHFEEASLREEKALFSRPLERTGDEVWLLRRGVETRACREELAPGDGVVLRTSYVAPADGVIVEEHFSHPIARAIVEAAERAGLSHGQDRPGEVRYRVSRGVTFSVDGKRFEVGGRWLLDEAVSPESLEAVAALEAAGHSLVFVLAGEALAVARGTGRKARRTFRQVVAVNTLLLGLGLRSGMSPAAMALAHNLATVGFSLRALNER
jgi:cation transport ATPase